METMYDLLCDMSNDITILVHKIIEVIGTMTITHTYTHARSKCLELLLMYFISKKTVSTFSNHIEL